MYNVLRLIEPAPHLRSGWSTRTRHQKPSVFKIHLTQRRYAALPIRSEELAKVFDREARIAHDTAHGVGIHGVVPWNSYDAHTVSHDYMFPLPRDPEVGFLQCPNRIAMVDIRELGHD